MVVVTFLFWFGFIGALYSYFLYPLVLVMLTLRPAARGAPSSSRFTAKIAIIIAAYNEESRIRQKLENTLQLNKRDGDIAIIVASDGSTDGTHDVVREFASRGVSLVISPGRRGKEAAQLAAIDSTDCEILVFTDVATILDEQAIGVIKRNFEDPSVGAVSSTDRFVTESGEVVGEGYYVRYEMWLRQLESRVNTLVGLSGSFFAARRSVCEHWNIKVPSDFGTAINCVRSGFRAISDPALVGIYRDLKESGKEHDRKLRTMIRGMAGLREMREVLNPLRYGLFAFQVWSHKIMRWAVPWFMMLIFFCNVLLLRQGSLYVALLSGQILFYTIAVLPRLWKRTADSALVRLINFFVESNWAAARAAVMVAQGKTIAAWQPSRR